MSRRDIRGHLRVAPPPDNVYHLSHSFRSSQVIGSRPPARQTEEVAAKAVLESELAKKEKMTQSKMIYDECKETRELSHEGFYSGIHQGKDTESG